MASGNRPITIGLVRHGKPMDLAVTPPRSRARARSRRTRLQAGAVTFKEATVESLVGPADGRRNLVIACHAS